MTRTIMREHIFKILFREMFHDANELDEQIRFYFDELTSAKEAELTYISEKAKKISGMTDTLDEKINSVSEGWPTNRLGKAELSIMRLAVYEMLYDDDIPVNVAIDEAVELAKKYGADNASSFINGVLAKLTK
ncbi:MAG: transcription antitermination factor NusB [Eubacteriales bacterium]|nr:transcription antitermination factor NusB [Eubacteriales bacterium]